MNQTITLNIHGGVRPIRSFAELIAVPWSEWTFWEKITLLFAKRVNTEVLDKMLDVFKTGSGTVGPCTRMTVCASEPTTYTEGNATYALADVTMAGADFTLANGDGAGNTPRKVTMSAKNGVTVDTSGTAQHVALLDVTNSKLLEVTTCTSQALTAANTVNFPSWKIEIGAPT